MSNMFGGGGGDVKLPPPRKIEEQRTVTETAGKAKQRERDYRGSLSGRQSTMLAGMEKVLAQRLGQTKGN